jgi:transcriptional regulator with XRE-family HTH domain
MAFRASWAQRRLAGELADLRKAEKLSTREVADGFGWNASKVSRIENAQVKVESGDVIKLARLYGVPDGEVGRLCDMARESRTDIWWDRFAPWLPEPYYNLIGYENDATKLRCMQATVIPGLLQARGYATSVINTSPSVFDADKADALIEVRALRQRRLTEPEPLELDAIIAEPVLHWAFGGGAVLHEQLKHLRELSDRSNVTVRVVPYTSAIVMLPLELYEFGQDGPSIAFSETLWHNVVHEGELETKRATRMLDHVASMALSPDMTNQKIEQRIRETK